MVLTRSQEKRSATDTPKPPSTLHDVDSASNTESIPLDSSPSVRRSARKSRSSHTATDLEVSEQPKEGEEKALVDQVPSRSETLPERLKAESSPSTPHPINKRKRFSSEELEDTSTIVVEIPAKDARKDANIHAEHDVVEEGDDDDDDDAAPEVLSSKASAQPSLGLGRPPTKSTGRKRRKMPTKAAEALETGVLSGDTIEVIGAKSGAAAEEATTSPSDDFVSATSVQSEAVEALPVTAVDEANGEIPPSDSEINFDTNTVTETEGDPNAVELGINLNLVRPSELTPDVVAELDPAAGTEEPQSTSRMDTGADTDALDTTQKEDATVAIDEPDVPTTTTESTGPVESQSHAIPHIPLSTTEQSDNESHPASTKSTSTSTSITVTATAPALQPKKTIFFDPVDQPTDSTPTARSQPSSSLFITSTRPSKPFPTTSTSTSKPRRPTQQTPASRPKPTSLQDYRGRLLNRHPRTTNWGAPGGLRKVKFVGV